MSRIKRWIEEQIGTDNEQYLEQYLDDMFWEQYQMEYEMYEDYLKTNIECESE